MNNNSEELAPRQGFTSSSNNIITSICNQFNGLFNTQAASEGFNRRPVVPRPSHIDLVIKKKDRPVVSIHSHIDDVITKMEDNTEDMEVKIGDDLDVKVKVKDDLDVNIKIEGDLDVKVIIEDDLNEKVKIKEDSYVNKEPTSTKRVVNPTTSAESNQIDERPSQFTRAESIASTSSNITQTVVSSATPRRRRRRPYQPPTHVIRNRLSPHDIPGEPFEFRSPTHRPANYVPYPYGPTSFDFQRVPRRVNEDALKLISSFYNKN